MPDAPLSRRARRTFEEEAADRAASQEPTLALPQGLPSGEVDAAEEARAALSRRDRRRMERFNHPLEAWTAEEEMLATGQIPVMTPERIAEQERISREKAEKAAEEAIAASQEFRRLRESDMRRAPEPVLEEPASPRLPSQLPVAQPPVAQAPSSPAPAAQPPVLQAPWAHDAPTDFPGDFEFASKPSWPEQPAPPVHTPPGLALPESREAGTPATGTPATDSHAAAAHEGRPVLEPYQPVMALDDTPLVPVVHPAHHEAPVEADLGSADEPAPQHSSVFEALFPPGSSQAALRQQDPFAAGVSEEQARAASGHVPALLPPQEIPERAVNPVDEIRRLAAEAMSGIERASKADEEAAAAARGTTPDPSVRAEFDSLPSASLPTQQAPSTARPLAEFAWGAEAGSGQSVNHVDANPTFDSMGELSQRAQPAHTTPSGGAPSQYGQFDQLAQPSSGSTRGVAPSSGQFPMPGQQGQPASGQFPMPGQQGQPASGQFPMPGQQGQPASGQFPMPGQQGPAWNSQPLNTEPGRAAEAQAFTPLSNVPRPDFSGLYQQGSPSAFPPLTGAINTAALNSAEFHGGDMSASAQVTGIRRPDLPEVGGVKHFKWLHLSVIGALMFVLGVVIYNVAFNK